MTRLLLSLAAAASLAATDLQMPMIGRAPADSFAVSAPVPWLTDDPADSLYRVARQALNKGQYQRAADLFAELVRRHPKSGYAGDALYWQAFARYRQGGTDNLRSALENLEQQRTGYPTAATRGDAEALATRIRGTLARQGDPDAAETVVKSAASAGEATGGRDSPSRDCDDDSDVKLAALNAVLQMDAERAMPLLTRVLARRDPGSVCLRRKAVFLVAQHQSPDAATLLLNTVRSDPDSDVRQQAVFWLSQVNSPQVVGMLDSIARSTGDQSLQERAVFALSQQNDPKAIQAIRAIAERKDVAVPIREKAIFWLGQSKDGGGEYLKSLYDRLDNDDLRAKVIFSVAQHPSPESTRWLFERARDEKTTLDLRKQAIFWSSQSGASAAELGSLYQSLQQRELKEQTIFALSQLKDSSVVTQLIGIARKDSDPEMRKKAVFWLGQSSDPRAAAAIEQILND